MNYITWFGCLRVENVTWIQKKPYIEILDSNGKHKGTFTLDAAEVDWKNHSFERTTDHPGYHYEFNIRGGLYRERLKVWREAKLNETCTYTTTESCSDGKGGTTTCTVTHVGSQDILVEHQTVKDTYRVLFEDPMLNRTNIGVFETAPTVQTISKTLEETSCS